MLFRVFKPFQSLVFTSTLLATLSPFSSQSLAQEISQRQLQKKTDKPTTIETIQPKKMSDDSLLAESIKASVVRISVGCQGEVSWIKQGKSNREEIPLGHGSGFFVNSNGHIVTNAHVIDFVENPNECKEILRKMFKAQLRADGEQIDDVKELRVSESKPFIQVYLSNGEKIPAQLVLSGSNAGPARDVAIIKVNLTNTPSLLLTNSEEVNVFEDVIAVGFPGVADINEEGEGMGFYQPSFTEGKLSAKKYLDGSPVLQVSSPTTHGNSGGPIVNRKGEVIGITTFHKPNRRGQQITGFSFLVASNTIQDFLKQAGIVNNEGLVTKEYRIALGLYNQEQYDQAIQKFQAVKKLFPQHSGVNTFIYNSELEKELLKKLPNSVIGE